MNPASPALSPILEHDGQRRSQGGMLWLWLVLLLTTGVYWQSTSGELVYDDLSLIGENPLIGDLGNIPELLLKPLWDFQNPGSSEQTGYWRPLTSIVYALAWAVDGGATWAFHWASILFHLGATAGCFLLARRLSGQAWLAASVALLFGLHPVHVESVAWISSLNDPLFATFVFFSLASFCAWRQAGSRGLPWCASLCFALALLSKEMALCLLPMLWLVDLYASRMANQRGALKDWFQLPAVRLPAYLPFGVVLALYYAMRVWIFNSPQAGFERSITDFGVGSARMALLRVEVWGSALKLLSWPSELRLFRPFVPNLSSMDRPALLNLGATAISFLILLMALVRKRRELFFAFLIIPISLAPVLVGTHALGLFPASDRYLYLAVFGSSLFLLLLLRSLFPQKVVLTLVLIVAAFFGKQSFDRSLDWHSELQLFGAEAKHEPRSPYVYWGHGRVLLNAYSKTLNNSYLEAAKRAFENSMQLLEEAKLPKGQDIFASSNDYLQANLGYAHCVIIEESLYSEGNADTSIALLTNLMEAVSKIHREAELARSQGKLVIGFLPPMELIFAALGAAHFAARDWNQAAEALGKSLRLNPRNIHALKTLAKVDFARGNKLFAISNLRKALEIAPRNGDLQLSLAQILLDSGESQQAEALARRLLEIMPEHPGPRWVLAGSLMQANRPREALIQLHQAQKLDEYNGHTWLLIAQAMYAIGGDSQGTLDAFRKAAYFKSGDITAHYNLASLLLQDGELQEAIPHFIKAYALATEPQVLANLRAVLPSLPFEDPAAFVMLSQADWRRKQLDLVEFWLNRALALNANHTPAMMEMGRLLIKRERIDEGLDYLRRASERSGLFSDALEYGQFLFNAERQGEARQVFEAARQASLPPELSESERSGLLDSLLDKLDGKQRMIPIDASTQQ